MKTIKLKKDSSNGIFWSDVKENETGQFKIFKVQVYNNRTYERTVRVGCFTRQDAIELVNHWNASSPSVYHYFIESD